MAHRVVTRRIWPTRCRTKDRDVRRKKARKRRKEGEIESFARRPREEEDRRRARGREGREETEIEKGRGRWRLQGYTRPEQGPARSRERASARGEARLRFPRCLLAARPRLSRMLLHAMLLRYTSNIKVEEGMEKRATRANSTKNGGKRKTERARERKRERESERGGARPDERGRKRRTGEGEGGTTQQSCTRRVINICFRSPPPAAVIRKRGSPPNSLLCARLVL